MTLEKKTRPPLASYILPSAFVLAGAWYLIQWAISPPPRPALRAAGGALLTLYGAWRLARLRKISSGG
ncbi:MAG: hypothetical protein CFK52_09270 [Chloracidobacterium sp. CP2_5A]|nr:MAG: hypothetical protein CFK52_09270 [Chloracidobacterium sp. CP2_5A]